VDYSSYYSIFRTVLEGETVDVYWSDEDQCIAVCPEGLSPQDADSVILGGESAQKLRDELEF
jgi:hypothetical protein